MRTVRTGALVTMLMVLAPGWAQDTAKKADVVRVVSYKELGDEIAKHKGKVVLVDFWFTT